MAGSGPQALVSTLPAIPDIRTLPLSSLKPARYNPREIAPDALKALEASCGALVEIEPGILRRYRRAVGSP